MNAFSSISAVFLADTTVSPTGFQAAALPRDSDFPGAYNTQTAGDGFTPTDRRMDLQLPDHYELTEEGRGTALFGDPP